MLDTFTVAGYTLYQLCSYFLLYSFVGWCVEVVFFAATTGKIVNRGFLNGPVCPIYGFGMLAVLILLRSWAASATLIFVGGLLLATAVELVGGWLMLRLFHARWWDYSDKPFNIHGFICLEFSLLWGLGAVVMLRVVHPAVASAAGLIPQDVGWILLGAAYALFLVDTIVSLCTVAGLNRDLKELDEVSASLRVISDTLSDNLGYTALQADRKLDEGRLQAKLATAQARDALTGAADTARSAAGRLKDTAQSTASDAYQSAAGAVGRLKDTAQSTASGAYQSAAGAVVRLKDTAQSTASGAYQSAAGAVGRLKDTAQSTAAEGRAALEARRDALQQRAETLRNDVLLHTHFGGGRLLKAFPQLAHTQYKAMLEDLQARLGRH